VRSARIAMLLAVGMLAACGGGDGDEEVQQAAATASRDGQFLYTMDAGTDWIGAVGRDAQARATSVAARTYAATLAADHEGIAAAFDAAQGAQLAESGPGEEIVREAQAARSALEGMRGTEYDLAFVESAIRLQQRLLSALERDVAVLQNPSLRQLAERTRPTLEAHIQRGRQLLPELRAAQAMTAPPATAASPSAPASASPAQRTAPQRETTTPAPRPTPARPTVPDTIGPSPAR
jgi:predicted outer membrane protein